MHRSTLRREVQRDPEFREAIRLAVIAGRSERDRASRRQVGRSVAERMAGDPEDPQPVLAAASEVSGAPRLPQSGRRRRPREQLLFVPRRPRPVQAIRRIVRYGAEPVPGADNRRSDRVMTWDWAPPLAAMLTSVVLAVVSSADRLLIAATVAAIVGYLCVLKWLTSREVRADGELAGVPSGPVRHDLGWLRDTIGDAEKLHLARSRKRG